MEKTKTQKKENRPGTFQKGHTVTKKRPEELKTRVLKLYCTEEQFQDILKTVEEEKFRSPTKYLRYKIFGVDERKVTREG